VNSTWKKLGVLILANSHDLLPAYLPTDVIYLVVRAVFKALGMYLSVIRITLSLDKELSDQKRYNPFEFSNEMTLLKDRNGSLACGTWTQIIKWETSPECDGTPGFLNKNSPRARFVPQRFFMDLQDISRELVPTEPVLFNDGEIPT
jgi:hypothetical protein